MTFLLRGAQLRFLEGRDSCRGLDLGTDQFTEKAGGAKHLPLLYLDTLSAWSELGLRGWGMSRRTNDPHNRLAMERSGIPVQCSALLASPLIAYEAL